MFLLLGSLAQVLQVANFVSDRPKGHIQPYVRACALVYFLFVFSVLSHLNSSLYSIYRFCLSSIAKKKQKQNKTFLLESFNTEKYYLKVDRNRDYLGRIFLLTDNIMVYVCISVVTGHL
jgi:hypothetical protein